jgi:hypothetical protein
MTRVIALCGRARSGKSTAAQAIAAKGGTRISLADPIKAMLLVLLRDYAGVPDADARIFGDRKEDPIMALACVSGRRLMQTLGTEWGRHTIGPDLWAEIMVKRIERLRDPHRPLIVIDDVRFINEAEILRDRCGAQIVRVVRPGLKHVADHASEQEIEAIRVDYELLNDCQSAEAFARVARAMFERGEE